MKRVIMFLFLLVIFLAVALHIKPVEVNAQTEKSSVGIRFIPGPETPTKEKAQNENRDNHSQNIGKKKYPQTNDRQTGSLPIISGIFMIAASGMILLLKKRKREKE